jgi:hypothetical protein
MDHAGAFAESSNSNFAHGAGRSRNLETSECGLLDEIGREDGLGRLRKMARLGPIDAASSGITATSFSAGSGTPMIPVDDGNTSSARQPKMRAAAEQVSRAARTPGSPAAQLALPALIATTRIRPPVALKCSLSI